MKVLFDHALPFCLAHGGFQVQIEQTKAALESVGVEVEYLRWWDDQQAGDLIHYFGRPGGGYVDLAHQKGMRVVVGELLTGLGSRSEGIRRVQRLIMTATQKLLPSTFTSRLNWETYQRADAFIALTSWEAHLMREMFRAPAERVFVIPNGVEETFFRPAKASQNYLVCTATITERKRVLELAQAAVLAGTPVRIVGRPYAETDAYFQKFLELARQHPEIILYAGAVSDRDRLAEIYNEARGFVLLSTMESLSLSALEAAACGCPLFLSKLPWATASFGEKATYCPVDASPADTATGLKTFFDQAPSLPRSPKPLTWREVAVQVRGVYEQLLSTQKST